MKIIILFLVFFLPVSSYAAFNITVTYNGVAYSASANSTSCSDVKTGFSLSGITVNSCSSDPVKQGGYLVAYVGGGWNFPTITAVTDLSAGVTPPVSVGATTASTDFWSQSSALNALFFVGLVICFGLGYSGGRLR